MELSKFGFLISLFGVLLVGYSNAQTPVCNLQVDIFELSADKPAKSVKGVKIVLIDSATAKAIKSSASAESLLFPEISSGRYKIEAIKDGYQRRIKEIEIKCRTVDEILTISKVLYLQKGDAKEVTKFGSTAYNVPSSNQQYVAADESILNGGALILVSPKYPAAARAVRATGAVNIQVTLDEDGEVVSANAVSGHPLLRQAAERAAIDSRFAPTILDGQPVIVTGIIVYNFVP